jgi:S1-C subfamily serine protease
MAPRFLGKTSLADVQLLPLDGQPVLSAHARLVAFLRERAPQAADLFAEPVITWGNAETAGVVSWYADTQGEAEALAGVSAERRQQMERQLRDVLAQLLPLLDDAAEGALLQRALHLADAAGIKAVGGRVLLTEWGMARQGEDIAADARAALAVSPLGHYLADAPVAPVTAVPRPVPAPLPAPPPPAQALPPVAERTVWNWWLVPTALAVSGLFLILGIWLGSRLLARNTLEPAPVSLFDEAAIRRAIDQQKQQNAALAKELEEHRHALGGDLCRVDPQQMPGLGPNPAAPVPPASVPAPPSGQQFHGSLAQLLQQAVVLVLVTDAQDHPKDTGSGFFVTPDTIVTNHHVVAEPGGHVYVTNPALGRATPAQVTAMTPHTAEDDASDIAILHLEQPVHVQPLALATVVAPLDSVIAAGFPGLTVQADAAFGRLLHGDASAVPQVILTDGKVEAIQNTSGNVQVMPHTALISGGNSGGPLVDACGRVVGLNTFIVNDRDQVAHVNYAQKIDSVVEFLAQHGSPVQAQTTPCNTATAQAGPAQAGPASAGTTQAGTPQAGAPNAPQAQPQPQSQPQTQPVPPIAAPAGQGH